MINDGDDDDDDNDDAGEGDDTDTCISSDSDRLGQTTKVPTRRRFIHCCSRAGGDANDDSFFFERHESEIDKSGTGIVQWIGIVIP